MFEKDNMVFESEEAYKTFKKKEKLKNIRETLLCEIFLVAIVLVFNALLYLGFSG